MKKHKGRLLVTSFILTFAFQYLFVLAIYILDYFENDKYRFICEYVDAPYGQCTLLQVLTQDATSRVILGNIFSLGIYFIAPFFVIFSIGMWIRHFKEERELEKNIEAQRVASPNIDVVPTVTQTKKSKVRLYLITFIALLALYGGSVLFAYIPWFPNVVAATGMVVLGFLFYEIYKKYKNDSEGGVSLLVFLIILWVALFAIQVEYIPAKTVVVKDVFGAPIENIPVGIQDYVGQTFDLAGGNAEYRHPQKYLYMTNEDGEAHISSRFYFAGRRMSFIYLKVNDSVFGSRTISGREKDNQQINRSFDSRTLRVHKEKIHEVSLASLIINYEECNSITNVQLRNECLVYGLFYSAVKGNRPELCALYDEDGVKRALAGSHRFYLRREGEVERECLVFTKGVLGGDKSTCEEIESEHYRGQCNCMFNPDSCEGGDAMYRKGMTLLAPLFGNPSFVNDYLCRGNELRESGVLGQDYRYSMFEIRFLGTAVNLYKQMFCESQF